MASERTNGTLIRHREVINPDRDVPWADLELTVPNEPNHASVVALVECALVELTREAVGTEYVSRQVGKMKRAQFIAVDDDATE